MITKKDIFILTTLPVLSVLTALWMTWHVLTYGKCAHYIINPPTKGDVEKFPNLDRNTDGKPCSNNKY